MPLTRQAAARQAVTQFCLSSISSEGGSVSRGAARTGLGELGIFDLTSIGCFVSSCVFSRLKLKLWGCEQ